MSGFNISRYLRKQRELVDLEREAAKLANIVYVFYFFLSLPLRDYLFFKSTDVFRRAAASGIRVGDNVKVSHKYASGDEIKGVIKFLEEKLVRIFLEPEIEKHNIGEMFEIAQDNNDVPFERMLKGLTDLFTVFKNVAHPSHATVRVLLAKDDADVDDILNIGDFSDQVPSILKLDRAQKNAVLRALNSNVAVIHGPPGTGKTTTLAAFIKAEVSRGSRVLTTVPSNITVDTLAERLVGGPDGLRLIRVG
eukprot:IDg8597t1